MLRLNKYPTILVVLFICTIVGVGKSVIGQNSKDSIIPDSNSHKVEVGLYYHGLFRSNSIDNGVFSSIVLGQTLSHEDLKTQSASVTGFRVNYIQTKGAYGSLELKNGIRLLGKIENFGIGEFTGNSDTYKIIVQGNSPFAGTTLFPNLYYQSFSGYKAGVGVELGNSLKFKILPSVVVVDKYSKWSLNNSSLFTDTLGHQLDMLMDFSSENNSSPGLGMGLDMEIEIPIDENNELKMGFKDLSIVRFSELNNTVIDTQLSVSGFNLVFPIGQADSIAEIYFDSLKGIVDTSIFNNRVVTMPVSFSAQWKYSLDKVIGISELGVTLFDTPEYYMNGTVIQPVSKYLSVFYKYSWSKTGGFTFGLGTGLCWKNVTLNLYSSAITGLLIQNQPGSYQGFVEIKSSW